MNKNRILYIVLSLMLVVVVVTSGFIGAVKITPEDILEGKYLNIYQLRWIRILLGLIAGMGLSVAGVIFQGILRNPLAEPYILGVSSGAGLGAVAVIALAGVWGMQLIPLGAFIGAVLTIVLVYNISQSNGIIPVQTLILSGVVVSAVFASILMFLVSTLQNEKLHNAMWWLLGNLEIFDIKLLIISGIITLAGILTAIFFARDINIISLGDEQAVHLGIDVNIVKKILFVVASLITAGVVTSCGIIGFVGIIIPHTMRLIAGPDHRRLIPCSALSGAIFLITADTIARVIILPAEVPIGVITALIGGPFFILLLKQKSQGKSC